MVAAMFSLPGTETDNALLTQFTLHSSQIDTRKWEIIYNDYDGGYYQGGGYDEALMPKIAIYPKY